MIDFDENYIVDFIKKNKVVSYKKIVKGCNVLIKDNKSFSHFLLKLEKEKKISKTKNREYFVPKIIQTVEGDLRLSSKGFGFIDFKLSDGKEESAFIPFYSLKTAMNNDVVEVAIFEDPEKPRMFQGWVTKVLKRHSKTFVAMIKKNNAFFEINPLDQKVKGRFKFKTLENVKDGITAKLEITKFHPKVNEVKIINVLGKSDEPSIDVLASIENSNLPHVFNFNVLNEAKKIPLSISEKDLLNRKDLRKEMIVTIDGDDTKDFDDAIYVRKKENGNFLLGVYIADVTHYVKEGSPLDEEALNRGTSIYLADRVIPMLPFELSNGICSLNPNSDRLVIAAEMEINNKGKTVEYNIFPAVICSKARLTYKEVNNFYHDQKVEKITNNLTLSEMLKEALTLSRIIRKSKEQEGYIDFEIEESKIIFNEKGETIDIIQRERLESEMLIEDFMVRANECVAKHVSTHELPFIYRVHDKPSEDRVLALEQVTKILNIDVNIPHSMVPISFAKTIKQIKETRFDSFMKILMLRTMSKAEYSSKNIGHFGLASKFYTHFTSPIRRYPDLMVHRMLREYFFQNKQTLASHFQEILPSIASHSSEREVSAMELERKVDDMKKAEYFSKLISKKMSGTIVSIMNFGFFVEFENKVDGLVHVSTLMDGNYKLVNNGYVLSNGKKEFRIGDVVDVIVVKASKWEGKIDLVLANMYEQWTKSKEYLKK